MKMNKEFNNFFNDFVIFNQIMDSKKNRLREIYTEVKE